MPDSYSARIENMGSGKTYDYIIAGAGSAGCTLAARLAEDPDINVLLVEAGGDGKGLFVRMPAGNGFLFGNPEYDWGFESETQPGLNGRRIYYPRGRGLGGSSLLNGMIYIRGNARDFDRWRAYGLDGWGYADVLPYFKRSEGAPHRDRRCHGHSGPLRTSSAGSYERITQRFVEAVQQAGAPLNPDFNGASQLGVGRFDTKVWRGQRQSASAAYLANPPANLSIATRTRVLKVAMDGERATGIEVADENSTHVVRAEREVILSLGAFTP